MQITYLSSKEKQTSMVDQLQKHVAWLCHNQDCVVRKIMMDMNSLTET
jgi:hypothetical protein